MLLVAWALPHATWATRLASCNRTAMYSVVTLACRRHAGTFMGNGPMPMCRGGPCARQKMWWLSGYIEEMRPAVLFIMEVAGEVVPLLPATPAW